MDGTIMEFKECLKCKGIYDESEDLCPNCKVPLIPIAKPEQKPISISRQYFHEKDKKGKAKRKQGLRDGIMILSALVALLIYILLPDSPKPVEVKPVAVNIPEIQCMPDSALCLGKQNRSKALPQCVAAIESRSLYDFKWTDGLFGEPKFRVDDYMWVDPANGVIAYSGNQIQMQNGFGAWKRVNYQCQFNVNLGIVTKVILM